MNSMTVEEAIPSLGRLVDLALAGEQIQIRKGNGVVELKPASPSVPLPKESLSPREALRCLQDNARLTQPEADQYLREISEERKAAEDQRRI